MFARLASVAFIHQLENLSYTSKGNHYSSRLKWLLLLGFISLLGASDSSRPHGLYSPWNSLGHNTGVGSLSLHQGMFLIQGLNPGLPHCRRILYQLSHKGSPITLTYDSINLSLRLLRLGAKCGLSLGMLIETERSSKWSCKTLLVENKLGTPRGEGKGGVE